MRALCRGTKQSEKTKGVGEQGVWGKLKCSWEFVCQGLLALESFLFRFIVTLRENFCYFSRPAFTGVTPASCRSSRCERALKAEVAR